MDLHCELWLGSYRKFGLLVVRLTHGGGSLLCQVECIVPWECDHWRDLCREKE